MKNLYLFTFVKKPNKTFQVRAKSRQGAIDKFCMYHAASKEWVKDNIAITKLGVAGDIRMKGKLK